MIFTYEYIWKSVSWLTWQGTKSIRQWRQQVMRTDCQRPRSVCCCGRRTTARILPPAVRCRLLPLQLTPAVACSSRGTGRSRGPSLLGEANQYIHGAHKLCTDWMTLLAIAKRGYMVSPKRMLQFKKLNEKGKNVVCCENMQNKTPWSCLCMGNPLSRKISRK